MIAIRLLITVGVLHAVTTPSQCQLATPFGIRDSMTLTALEKVAGPIEKSQDDKGFYFLSNVPTPHPSLQQYGVFYSPSTGVCQVTAIAIVAKPDPYGKQVRTVFDGLRKQLVTTYGPPTLDTDELKDGSP